MTAAAVVNQYSGCHDVTALQEFGTVLVRKQVNTKIRCLTLKKITTMKTKNILMSILLVIGSIAAKAAGGYPPELALVSQPVMVYNYNSVTVIYDVENIGDYTYRGYVSLYLDPDYGYSYAEKYVRVYPGRIKRIEIDIPLYRIDRRFAFTIMPYYELGNELYSFTTFEYFEPISFYWNGPRTERWVVITIPPRIHYYHRPGTYRFYYDGYRPPMPPPGHGPGMPPPMDPHHHTYGYHHSNGGYPATHPENNPSANNNAAPTATVRPKVNGGSMSSGSSNSGGNNTPAPTPNNGGSNSGRTSSSNSSGRVSGSSGRTDNPTSTRPATNSESYSRPSGNSNSSSSRVSSGSTSRPSSGSSNSGSSRANSSSSNSRSSGTSSSTSSRASSSSSNTRNSGASSSSSRSSSSSSRGSSSNNSRSGRR